jgi:hypothetical protein
MAAGLNVMSDDILRKRNVDTFAISQLNRDEIETAGDLLKEAL